MATERQKEAARQNIEKAREVQSERAHGENIPRETEGLSTAEKDRLTDSEFAFPKERKEPLTDARHVRNAIARFDQVEGVSDKERDQAAHPGRRETLRRRRFRIQLARVGSRRQRQQELAGQLGPGHANVVYTPPRSVLPCAKGAAMGQDPDTRPDEEPEYELKPAPYPKIGTGPVLEERPPELLSEADGDSTG